MEKYPRKKLNKLLANSNLSAFYKVLKTRPEALHFLIEHEFDPFQIDEIISGFADGLSLEHIQIYAKPSFSSCQMYQLRTALAQHKLTMEQVQKIANPELDEYQMQNLRIAFCRNYTAEQIDLLMNLTSSQMEEVLEGFLDGLTIEQVKLYANPNFDEEQMWEIRYGFFEDEDNIHLSTEEIVVYAKPIFSAEQMREIRKSLESGLVIEEVEFFAKPEFSAEQMKQIAMGFENYFTGEQLKLYATTDFDGEQMEKIRLALQTLTVDQVKQIAQTKFNAEQMAVIAEAMEDNFSDEELEIFMNPDFDEWQMEAIMLGIKDNLTLEQVKFYAMPEINNELMNEIRGWLKKGYMPEQMIPYLEGFTHSQFAEIMKGFEDKLSLEEIELYAKPEFSNEEMQIIRDALRHNLIQSNIDIIIKCELPMWCKKEILYDFLSGLSVKKILIYARCKTSTKFSKVREKVLNEEIRRLLKS